MFKNYLTIAWRNLVKNKLHSFINIAGLSIGMAVAVLIGLWVWDECSFNKNFAQYDRIAQVMQKQTFNGEVQVWSAVASPLGPVLRQHYGHDFAHVVRAGWTSKHLLEVRGDAVRGEAVGGKQFSVDGNFMEPEATELLSLNMLEGTRAGLRDMNSILLSARLANILFGNADPMDKMIRLDNRSVVKVTGVYEDMPYNSTFADLGFLAPWDLIWKNGDFEHILHNPWGASWFQTFAEIAPHADMQQVSHQIKNAKLDAISDEDEKRNKPEIILQPMRNWHLYAEFKNGVNVGGRIMYVWLFGTIGIFVLLLACINFMNLSTARSEKRAKEVGIRKSIGSGRGQLISQFFMESLLVVFFSFILSLLLVLLALPFFNQVADKKVTIPFTSPWFWGAGILFSLLTGLIAGSYPSFYLSSFRPVRVLKGSFRAGRLAAIPRKALVVLQFTVSVTLIIGTVVVYRQIRFAKDRPVGYSRDGLVTMNAGGTGAHYAAFRAELIKTGMVADVAGSESDITNDYVTNSGLSWTGKDPALQEEFVTNGVTADFGKTTGWQIVEGRDFSPAFTTDSAGIILNETAVKYMGFKHPIGEVVQWGKNRPVHVIGVVKDMITQNPYEPVKQSFFYLSGFLANIFMSKITLRVNPREPMRAALASIESVYRKYSPDQPFSYTFADDEYAKKFNDEERIGHLASSFAMLAIFISCLGLFGMAAFMAEQRTKEIGVRKVLGASVYNLWLLLSAEFVTLVVLSFLIASPLAYYLMHEWLQHYTYRSGLPVWIFAVAGGGAICITLLTVSFQSVKAALANPVKSLRTEG